MRPLEPPRRHALLLALVALAIGATACSDDGSAPKSTLSTPRTTASVDVTVGTVTVATAGFPTQLPDADRDAVLKAVATYVDYATFEPLLGTTAKTTAERLTGFLAPTAVSALSGPEADSLSDATIGRAKESVKATLAPVNITGLADPTGAIDLVGATLDLTVNAMNTRGEVEIHRVGELVFVRDPAGWKLLGFRLAVTRGGAGLGTASSSTSTTTGGETTP